MSEFCEVCTASKMHEVAMPKKTESRASAVWQRVFNGIEGEFEVPSKHGDQYSPIEWCSRALQR